MRRIVFGLGILFVAPILLSACFEDGSLDPVSEESTEIPELGKADGDTFFHGYFLTEMGEVVTEDEVLEVGQGVGMTLKFTAPRTYGFEGGITAHIYDSYGYIPWGTAYAVDCGNAGDYFVVREDTSTEARVEEPVCQVSTDSLYPGQYTIGWEFYEYTYEGDYDWSSTRVLETGYSGWFVVAGE